MKEKVSALLDTDLAYFEALRDWLRAHFNDESRDKYNDLNGKLFLVDHILRNNLFDRNEVPQLHALGIGLGDALAQQLGMEWVIVEDDHGRTAMLSLPGTSLRLSALTMIQKRIVQGEEFEILSLFEALCRHVETIRSPKRSLLGRLFGPRLT
jgi:uncharacterized protein DUF3806